MDDAIKLEIGSIVRHACLNLKTSQKDFMFVDQEIWKPDLNERNKRKCFHIQRFFIFEILPVVLI